MKRNRILALCLGLALLTACAPKQSPAPTPTAEPTATPALTEPAASPTLAEDEKVRIAMLKGPTGLGAAKLMEDWEDSATAEFTICAEPTEAVALLTGGEVDIAALPTNLASTLYHKTDGGIRLLALNTLGVLYILENGDTVHSMADLAGKTLYATGQGANPEFVLNYLLEQNGLTPDDVDIQWMASDEVTTRMASGEASLCMLPVPAATSVMMQNGDVRAAVDFNEAWEKTNAGTFAMGCVAARADFVENNPEAVERFLEEYEASINYMKDTANLDNAAALAEKWGIVPKAAVAKKAIPDANLCFITGMDMMDSIQGYYEVLAAADPASIGGSIPDGAFYYNYDK